MKHASALSAKVAATNAANAEVNRLAPLYRALFAQYIGAKVVKADNSLLAAIKTKLPTPSPGFQVYSPHVGCFVVKVCVPYGEHSCVYAEPYFYAFTLDRHAGCVCQALGHEWEPLKADYTVEGVQSLRAEVEKAEEALRELSSGLGPFTKGDC